MPGGSTLEHLDVGAGLDPVAARAFLAKIVDDRLYALYLCAVVRGMRRGELLGLTWDAVDLDGGRLAVRQALSWVDGRAVIQPPKTRASRRVIPLPDVVVIALREHQKRQDAERADAGQKWADTGFVFTTRHGRPMSPYTLVKYWHEVREAAGLGTLGSTTCGTPPCRCFMMVYAHGNLTEKAAALAQLGGAVSGGLLSPVVVNPAVETGEDR